MAKEKYRGVCFIKEVQKYKSSVLEKKVNYFCGYFDTPKEAVLARDKMIISKNLSTPLQVLSKKK